MNTLIELVAVKKNDLGRTVFTLAFTNEDGTHTDTMGAETLAKVIHAGAIIGVIRSEIMEDLKRLTPVYYEWAEDVMQGASSEDDVAVIDIYSHDIKAVDGYLVLKYAGDALKTYKREAPAKKVLLYESKQFKLILK